MGGSSALCCCQTVPLQFGEVFQASKPSFTHRSEGFFVKRLPDLWIGIFNLENMETFLPPSKRWQELLEITKVACGRIKSPFNHKRQKSLKG